MLKVEGLKKSYFQGERKIEVLKDLSFSLEKGKTLAILGQSGSGKSTLLSLLSGVDTIDEGDIVFNDFSFRKAKESELTLLRGRSVGIIFQQFHLLPHLNALENVSLALEILGESNIQERSHKVLEQVGLGHRLSHFPSQLSGGEKQRVAIARSLAIGPELLLADEPSGSLDEETGEDVIELLFSLVKEKGTSMILVTHNKALASLCDQTMTLNYGKLELS